MSIPSPKRAAAYFRRFGGALMYFDRPALTPALTGIGLFGFAECMLASDDGTMLNERSFVAVQFTPKGVLSAGQAQSGFLMPNVRAKLAPMV